MDLLKIMFLNSKTQQKILSAHFAMVLNRFYTSINNSKQLESAILKGEEEIFGVLFHLT